ncbi:MAG: GxxExxY protein [Verrucomicrobiota bacterium]
MGLEFEIEKDPLTEQIIGCAIQVHRTLGPGLLEATYESALAVELEWAGVQFCRQKAMPITYRDRLIGEYRLDLVVENAVIVELKSVERFDPIFEAQLLAYMKVARLNRGLLLNFNSRLLKDGIKRMVL